MSYTVPALTFDYVGAFVSFAAYHQVSGSAEIIKIAQTCEEKTEPDVGRSVRSECIGRILTYITSTSEATVVEGYIVGTTQSAFSNPTSSYRVDFGAIIAAVWLMALFSLILWGRDLLSQPTAWTRICIRSVDVMLDGSNISPRK